MNPLSFTLNRRILYKGSLLNDIDTMGLFLTDTLWKRPYFHSKMSYIGRRLENSTRFREFNPGINEFDNVPLR
jgi:hypothetical protein